VPRTINWDPPRTPFTLEHVAASGVTRAALRTAVASGRIVPLVRGVYVAADAVAADPAGRHVQSAIAHQVRRPWAIASHHTAALAWGLQLDDPVSAADAPVSLMEPARPDVRSQRGRGFTIAVRDLPAGHQVWHPCGLRVTSVARTAVDVAAGASVPEALVVLDAAARRTLVEAVGRRRVRENHARPLAVLEACRPMREAAAVAATQRTRAHLDRVVVLADPRRESPLESLSYGQMLLHGLPLPQMQVRIRTELGDAYPDFLWADARLIGEADGLTKYGHLDDLHREKLRQQALEVLGYRVIRWTYRDLRRSPGTVMARISAALEVPVF
jgi:very-short-patch-repair endonuclease